MNQKAEEARRRARRQDLFLHACLFVTGACTLVLEIVGTRLISPYFGSSLYTWSALITVTLVSLAAGYHWGGRVADRTPALTVAARLLAGAGLAVAVTPALRVPVLKLTAPLGVQAGALASALVLVAPTLVLLSALGPLTIRLVTESVSDVGRRSGRVYAVSTLGSVLGAVAAGFVLIPLLPLSKILFAVALVLLALSAWAHHLSQRALPAPQLALAAAAAAAAFWPGDGIETNIIFSRESAYGQIKVLDAGTRRYMLLNGTTQSMANLPDFSTDSQYSQVMELAAAARPGAKTALVMGLGAGLLSNTLEKDYGLTVDSVEIDPVMAEAARAHFGYAPKGELFLEDGRVYLERTDRRYDLIFMDAFGAEAPPAHLFTAEAFAAMKRRLNPGGLVVVNLVAALDGREARAWSSAHKTLRAVFPEVAAYEASDRIEDLGNIVFFCGTELPNDPRGVRPAARLSAAAALAKPLAPPADAGVLMTDDYAPLEHLLARTSVRWRAALQSKVADILLY